MKYIIIGLGNFGASLAKKLTEQGNEVIGVDTDMSKVNAFKEQISHTICMDATDEFAVSGLPLRDTDIVLVAIGKDQGANIMTTALLKNLEVKRLISRAINPLHEKVLQAIGIDEIVHPEEETAERWAKILYLRNVVDSYDLHEDYSVIKANVPEDYIGSALSEVNFKGTFNLTLLTVIKKVEGKSILGKPRINNVVQDVNVNDITLHEDSVLVLYGSNKDLQKFLKLKVK